MYCLIQMQINCLNVFDTQDLRLFVKFDAQSKNSSENSFETISTPRLVHLIRTSY